MKIGELAKATNTKIETIRYYEREGLLSETLRTEGNYRVYSDTHVNRLSFIRYCRRLDMTLDEIRILLKFKDSPEQNCAEVNELLDGHIGHVKARIKELKALEKQLKALQATCQNSQKASACGILNELSTGSIQDHDVVKGHVHGTHSIMGLKSK
jgi:Cd(II)/Pb(II)-responsive transcriptional regulator